MSPVPGYIAAAVAVAIGAARFLTHHPKSGAVLLVVAVVIAIGTKLMTPEPTQEWRDYR